MAIEQGQISTRTEEGICTITFSHPKSNSLPGETLAELAKAIEEAGKDPGVKVTVLKSAGEKAFCAGASFEELLSIEDREQGMGFFSGFAKVINAARKCPKLIIGRVQGKAVGGGVGIASAVDYCFATEASAIKLSELAIAIGPFVVGPPIVRKMGASAFSRLAINATAWQSAQWAKEKGLYMEVFSTISAMDAAIEELAGKLAASSPEAMRHLKQVLWEGTEHWDDLLTKRAAISGELALSEFTRKAIDQIKS